MTAQAYIKQKFGGYSSCANKPSKGTHYRGEEYEGQLALYCGYGVEEDIKEIKSLYNHSKLNKPNTVFVKKDGEDFIDLSRAVLKFPAQEMRDRIDGYVVDCIYMTAMCTKIKITYIDFPKHIIYIVKHGPRNVIKMTIDSFLIMMTTKSEVIESAYFSPKSCLTFKYQEGDLVTFTVDGVGKVVGSIKMRRWENGFAKYDLSYESSACTIKLQRWESELTKVTPITEIKKEFTFKDLVI